MSDKYPPRLWPFSLIPNWAVLPFMIISFVLVRVLAELIFGQP